MFPGFLRLSVRYRNNFTNKNINYVLNYTTSVYFDYIKPEHPFDLFFKSSVYGVKPRTKVGGKHYVTMVKGTGLGPEMMGAVAAVFACADVPVQFDVYDLPAEADDNDFEDVLHSIRRCGVCIKGFIDKPLVEGTSPLPSRNMRMRRDLDLFVNKMHCKTLPGIPSAKMKGKPVDIVVMRQNTEGEYCMLEHQPVPGVIEHLKVISRYQSERLARYAFEFAIKNKRRRVLSARVEGSTPLIFNESINRVAAEYPSIEYETKSVTAVMNKIFRHPEEVDIVITESLYGGVIANCIFGILGSTELVAGCNYGDRFAMFEPASRVRGVEMAGKGIANPTASLLSSVEMLRFLELNDYADMLQRAIIQTLSTDCIHTPDLGGTATTCDFVINVIKRVREMNKKISYCIYDQQPTLPSLPTSPTPPFTEDHPFSQTSVAAASSKNSNCKDS